MNRDRAVWAGRGWAERPRPEGAGRFTSRRRAGSVPGRETHFGYEVTEARNGREGVELARKTTPDLIVCDITMPEMNGHRVLETLREDARMAHVPFEFLTGWGEREDLRAGMNLGADDYLVKPM
eukprot:gene66259-90689_t